MSNWMKKKRKKDKKIGIDISKTGDHTSRVEVVNKPIFYFCDRKKCNPCNPECLHTRDINHALSTEGKREKKADGSIWQNALPDSMVNAALARKARMDAHK